MLEGVDVALLDRGLPDGDGLELIGALREVNPGARVFVISSTVEMIHPTDAMQAGAEGVIDKLDPPSRCSQRYGGREAARVPRRPIHRSAWKWNSANFASKEFSEVRIAPVQPLSASPAEIGTRRVLS
jgi:CheY-like chemotaxis protein